MLEPIEILWRRNHAFRSRDTKARTQLCETCGLGRNHASLIHYGAPPSLNFGGSGFDYQSYQGIKQAWQKMLCEQLIGSALPRGVIQRVVVDGQLGFDTYGSRDEGNFRYFVEKALGDALVSGYWELWPDARLTKRQAERAASGQPPLATARSRAKGKTRVRVYEGGWLPGDSFYPVGRFSFGHLDPVHTPGESHVRLMVIPFAEAETVPRGDQERLAV